MTDTEEVWRVRLNDLKARKGHLCQGGQYSAGLPPMCGCGARLDLLRDFMDLPPEQQRDIGHAPGSRKWQANTPMPPGQQSQFTVTGPVQPPVTVTQQRQLNTPMPPVVPAEVADGYIAESTNPPNEEPPLASGDDAPPAPFTHASGEPCYGCQSCFANILDDPDPPWSPHDSDYATVDPVAEADALEARGAAIITKSGAPDMAPAVWVIDPSQPYGPAEVERAILDANRRLEAGLKHEANLIAVTEELKVEYDLAYARAIERSSGGAADVRKANATTATERELRAWTEAKAARDAMKSITHTLRSTVSALQSVGRSVGVTYQGPQGAGR